MKFILSFLALLAGTQRVCGAPVPGTLLEMSHIHPKANLKKSILVLVDYQNEYTTGRLPLWQIQDVVKSSAELLQLARKSGVPVVHVIHDGGQGGLFDLSQKSGQIIDAVKPIEGERVIKKTFPNAFAGTELLSELHKYHDRDQLIIAGLMTHMCIASTASAAIDHGYFTTVVATTTTTRDLKGPAGETIPASTVKSTALATLQDRFSLVLNRIQELQP